MIINFQMRIDAGHQPLRSCFLITGGSIDLPCKIEVFDQLGFKGHFELKWREVIIFDGITRTEDSCILKSRDLYQCFVLNVFGE